MFVISEVHVTDGEISLSRAWGPFQSHAKANGMMQELYDAAKEEVDDLEGDDTEVSHFWLSDSSGDAEFHWYVQEVQDPASVEEEET